MIAKKVDMPPLGLAGPCKRRFENTAGYCGYVTRRPRWYPRIMRGASLDPHMYIYIYHHISSPSSCSFNWVKEIKRGIRKIDVEDSTGQLLSNFFFCIYAWNHRSSEIVEGHQNMTRASFRDIVGVFQYLLLFRSYTCTHTHTNTHTSLSATFICLGHPARLCPQWRQKGERRGLQRLQVPQKASTCGARIANVGARTRRTL
jgi:hypothetical protein